MLYLVAEGIAWAQLREIRPPRLGITMQKETRENSLGVAEREAFKKLETEIEEPMKLGMMAYNAIIGSLASLGDISLKKIAAFEAGDYVTFAAARE
jgi:hypothetical protein